MRIKLDCKKYKYIFNPQQITAKIMLQKIRKLSNNVKKNIKKSSIFKQMGLLIRGRVFTPNSKKLLLVISLTSVYFICSTGHHMPPFAVPANTINPAEHTNYREQQAAASGQNSDDQSKDRHLTPSLSRKDTTLSKEMTMVATAYDSSWESCGPWDGQTTASGLPVGRGIVAVDPKVIPLGTRLYVEGYGEAIAADTGGAIKGNRIDLYMESRKEALNYGIQTIKVRILN
jgi:3D (Asp-Asp-Asp) domain-containing protein